MKTITHIGAISLGKTLGLLYAVLGFIGGAVFFVISFVGSLLSEHSLIGAAIGFGLWLVFIIGYGILGLLFGYLTAWIYNIAAKYSGGISFEVS